ncbi:MAG: peptide-methionine (S)-S-oxide reductase MsrA [Planctomycetota bacterium]|jgi:peptide-methionine (S)-S-oxide reductase|nr:peptide-methionine (S)-S-oxide reductase [Planctomycetota bacterium]MDP6367971.1 peptide-methionine (S)-S-oxide reductase MsrA [Planctomycetota bacterium]MDP6520088.1 peptide-methionine (S)-S-oxide reductase MsrA [Planctomycetota bacterium]MDP6839962.1 peptide-methionine (S)-S-oxide reductase MsrA [Planctomycetota bacterium]MDP6956985.1 peptide-methionine (S)-S-oxide reductase MsrA [Planctomycetota bacterium]
MSCLATFAAGCFWGVEATFRGREGVLDTAVGYTGGTGCEGGDTNYEAVCTGRTGHAEAVRIQYDPTVISYDRLLDCFWACHDPTTKDRQGPDVGSQYRSAIFFHDEEQAALALAALEALQASGRFAQPVVTVIVPAGQWFRAEEHHQRYFEKNGGGSCGIG